MCAEVKSEAFEIAFEKEGNCELIPRSQVSLTIK